MENLQAKSSKKDHDANVEQVRDTKGKAEEDTYYSGPTVNRSVSSCLMTCKNFQCRVMEPSPMQNVSQFPSQSLVRMIDRTTSFMGSGVADSRLEHRISSLLTIVRKYLEHCISQQFYHCVSQGNLTEIPRREFLCDRHLGVCVMESADDDGWVEIEVLMSAAPADTQRKVKLGAIVLECHICEAFEVGRGGFMLGGRKSSFV